MYYQSKIKYHYSKKFGIRGTDSGNNLSSILKALKWFVTVQIATDLCMDECVSFG